MNKNFRIIDELDVSFKRESLQGHTWQWIAVRGEGKVECYSSRREVVQKYIEYKMARCHELHYKYPDYEIPKYEIKIALYN